MPTLKIDRFLFTLHFILLLWWAFFAGLGAPFAFGFYVDLSLFATDQRSNVEPTFMMVKTKFGDNNNGT